ncbi:hypothetical protein AAVH_36483 [Aphelenchoides avenae]|nr:hypothetical protein AAVH_36483 [Aphelenchus avenae]
MHPLKALKKGMRKKLQRGATPSDCVSLATASSVSLLRTPKFTRRRLVRSISDVKQLYRRSVCIDVDKPPRNVSLDSLCDPLLLRILKNLESSDVLSLRLVSQLMNNFVQRYSNELSKVDLGKLCLIGSTDGRMVRYSARTLHNTDVASEALQMKHIERALKHAACISLVLEFLVIDTGLISALADGLTSDVAELEIAQCYVNCR